MTTTTLTKKVNRLEERVDTMERLLRPKTQREIIQETAGLLRGTIKGNVVTWQRKIRRQWGKRLDEV